MKPKRQHTAAKEAGVTQIGCQDTTLETILQGIKAAKVRIRPRDLLRRFDGAVDLFCDIAMAIATHKGSCLEINFTVQNTNGPSMLFYNGQPVSALEIETRVEKSRKKHLGKTSKFKSVVKVIEPPPKQAKENSSNHEEGHCLGSGDVKTSQIDLFPNNIDSTNELKNSN